MNELCLHVCMYTYNRKLGAVRVFGAIVHGPGFLALAVEDAAAGEGEEVDVIDGDPFAFLVGQGGRIGVGLYGA